MSLQENLKAIRFSGELLPDWAQLLDLAARLCPVSETTRHWFSHFTSFSGTDDSRTIIDHCSLLRANIQAHRTTIAAELERSRNDPQSLKIIEAWIYTLDTMLQQARARETCSWIVGGAENDMPDDPGDGDITLRRV
ncbi:MAG TPA: hypothetical protein VN625_03645 [Desulfuromonadaceae bacterium]|nr:hypothetical protein [Desulfuromonadaceae bacterium]